MTDSGHTASRRVLGLVTRREFGLLALGGLAAACSGVPGTSGVHKDHTVSQPAPNVPKPNDEEQPTDLVKGFLSAAATVSLDSSTSTSVQNARAFLTGAAAQVWPRRAKRIIVVDSLRTASGGGVDTDARNFVNISGALVGTLDAAGLLTLATQKNAAYTATVTVDKAAGRWRISGPPDDIVLQRSDFERNYQRTNVYFLDATQTVVVPDPRWILRAGQDGTSTPASTSPPTSEASGSASAAAGTADRRVRRLLDLLLDGPTGLLAQPYAVDSYLTGASLRMSPLSNGEVTTVDLTGVKVATVAGRRALAAQIVFTLRELAPQVSILIEGQPLEGAAGGGPDKPYQPSSFLSFDPDRTPGNGGGTQTADLYYVATSTENRGEIRGLAGGPLWGSAGNGRVNVQNATLSATTGVLCVVGLEDDRSQQLYLGDPFTHADLKAVLSGDNLTPPSFSRTGDEVWVVVNGRPTTDAHKPALYQVSATLSAGAKENQTVLHVSAPFAPFKQISGFAVSPDGVRVAVVADQKLYLGVLSAGTNPDALPVGGAGSSTGTGNPTVVGLYELAPQLGSNVGPVLFSSAGYLLLAARTPNAPYATLQQVSIDGYTVAQFTDSGIQNTDVQALAVSSDGSEVYIATDTSIYQLVGSSRTGTWEPPNGRPLIGENPFMAN